MSTEMQGDEWMNANREERDMQVNATMGMEKPPEKPSFAVEAIRNEHKHEVMNHEDHAHKLSNHIRAIDDEIDALSAERARLAEECLKAAEAMSESREKFIAIATNDYQENRPNAPMAPKVY